MATDGAVDPLVGRQLELLGYDPTSLTAAPDSVAAPGSPTSRRSNLADGTYTATGQYGGLPSYGRAGGWFPGTQVHHERHIRAGGVVNPEARAATI